MKTYQINGAINGGLFNYIEIPLQYTPVDLSTLHPSLCAVIKISNSGGTLQVYKPNTPLNPFTTLDPGNSYVLLASQSFPLNIITGPIAAGQYDPSLGYWYSKDPVPTSLVPTTRERYWGGTINSYNSSVTSHLSAKVSLYTIPGEDRAQIFTLSASRVWDHPLPLDIIKGVAHGEENLVYTTYKGDDALRYYNNSLKQWFVLGSISFYPYSDSLVMSRSGNVIVSVAGNAGDGTNIPAKLTVGIGTHISGNWSTSNPGSWQLIDLPGLHKRSRIEPDGFTGSAGLHDNFYVMTDTHVFKIGKVGLLDSSYQILETHDFTTTVASFPGSRGITDITSYRETGGNDFAFFTIDKGTVIGKYPTSITPNNFVETVGNTSLVLGGQSLNCISYQESSNTLLVGVSGGKIFKSDNFGTTWQVTNSPNANWKAINNRISGNINKVYAVASPGYLYESNDFGMNWTILY